MPDAATNTERKFSPFTHTPDELLGKITEHLEFQDRLNLSSTCWRFRLALGSEFFKTTKFSNTERDSAMIFGLAKSKAKILVKQLHFRGQAPTDKSDDYQAISFIMPSQVHAILSDVTQFPNFEKLVIEFDFSLDKDAWKAKLCDLFVKLNIEEALAGESSTGWKALMVRTFEAVLANRTKGVLKDLEIRNLPPLLVSTYWNQNWRAFLAKVENFSLSVWGGDCCAPDKKVLSAQGYRIFCKHLDWSYFSRLTNAITVEFRPSTAGMLVGQSMAEVLWTDVHFPLDGSHMRKLKHLTFENIFVSVEMIDFIVSHAATLESLCFENCFAYEEHPEENVHRVGPSWQELFTAVAESRASRLRRLEVVLPPLPTLHVPPPREPGEDEEADDAATTTNDGHDETEEQKKAKTTSRELAEAREARPGAICFPYAHLSNKAELVLGWDFVLKHFNEGKDQDAYNGLMGIVQANALEVPTRLQILATKYKNSMSFNSARPANVKSALLERSS